VHGSHAEGYRRAPRGRLTTRYHGYIIGDKSDKDSSGKALLRSLSLLEYSPSGYIIPRIVCQLAIKLTTSSANGIIYIGEKL